jgi:hypothetical protein
MKPKSLLGKRPSLVVAPRATGTPPSAHPGGLLKLVQQLDEERRKRLAAEKQNTALRGVLTRLKQQRTADAKPVRHQDQYAC